MIKRNVLVNIDVLSGTGLLQAHNKTKELFFKACPICFQVSSVSVESSSGSWKKLQRSQPMAKDRANTLSGSMILVLNQLQ